MISASDAKMIALVARKRNEGDEQLEQDIDAEIRSWAESGAPPGQRIIVNIRDVSADLVERVRKVYASNGWETIVNREKRVGGSATLSLWMRA